MHLIGAKCNNTIITSLFHFASTFATQNVIKKNQNEINYYIITKRAATKLFFFHSNNRINVPLNLEENYTFL